MVREDGGWEGDGALWKKEASERGTNPMYTVVEGAIGNHGSGRAGRAEGWGKKKKTGCSGHAPLTKKGINFGEEMGLERRKWG